MMTIGDLFYIAFGIFLGYLIKMILEERKKYKVCPKCKGQGVVLKHAR
jgi:hypothetical protein